MAQRHRIERDLVAKIIVIGRRCCWRHKLEGMRNDLLVWERGRGKPRFDISLPRRLAISVIRSMRNLKKHAWTKRALAAYLHPYEFDDSKNRQQSGNGF